jgi:hypothetical protein
MYRVAKTPNFIDRWRTAQSLAALGEEGHAQQALTRHGGVPVPETTPERRHRLLDGNSAENLHRLLDLALDDRYPANRHYFISRLIAELQQMARDLPPQEEPRWETPLVRPRRGRRADRPR